MRARLEIPNRKFSFCLYFLLLQPFSSLVAAIPSLVDVAVVNTPSGFGLVPSALEFAQHQEYLLVLSNDNPESLTFHFSQFGQKIMTHYLQGTPSVSQESVDLPAKSKVLWQFSTLESGEFDYYISYPSQNIKGVISKMIIHPIEETPARKTSDEVLANNLPDASTTNVLPEENQKEPKKKPQEKIKKEDKRGSQAFGRKH